MALKLGSSSMIRVGLLYGFGSGFRAGEGAFGGIELGSGATERSMAVRQQQADAAASPNGEIARSGHPRPVSRTES